MSKAKKNNKSLALKDVKQSGKGMEYNVDSKTDLDVDAQDELDAEEVLDMASDNDADDEVVIKPKKGAKKAKRTDDDDDDGDGDDVELDGEEDDADADEIIEDIDDKDDDAIQTIDEDCAYGNVKPVKKHEVIIDEIKSDKYIVVPNNQRITKPYMTMNERVRILGDRAQQLLRGAKRMVVGTENMEASDIAKLELKMGKIPFKIRRPLPNGTVEIWYPSELKIIN